VVSVDSAGVQSDGSASSLVQRLGAPLNRWDIWARFDSQSSCEKEKEHLWLEAPVRLKFAREHPDQDTNGNIVAVSEAWQRANCIASNDPRLKSN
jgi:hypothetical protein